MQYLSTTEMRNQLDNPGTAVIDIRPVDAYNGWRLNDEPRGGHVRGARSFPAKWLQYMDWPDILDKKELSNDNLLVFYGYDTGDCEKTAKAFARAGYSDTAIYPHFTDEWTANSALPMEQLPRYRHLVPAEWLHTLMSSGNAPEYGNERAVLCHVHYRNPDDYTEGHIPGAIALDTNLLESEETWNRRSPAELRSVFRDLGITADTTVVLYGRFSAPDNSDPFPGSSAGHLGAMRCALIMLYAGVRDVRILNGGIRAWLDAGYETETETVSPAEAGGFGTDIPAHPEYAIDLPEAQSILASDTGNLVSIRSWREYIGEVSGYNYIDKKGRIPGSVFGNCGSDAYHMENYRNPDHTMREYHDIERIWASSGITPEMHNAFYCGTGWRGSEAFFNAWLMGWPRISVYDGGWYEWSSNPENPVETGVPATSDADAS